MKLGTKLILATFVVAGAAYGIHRVMNGHGRLRGLRYLRDGKGLTGIYEENAVVSSEVLGRAHHEIDTDALAEHVVHLSPKSQNQAYDISQRLWTATEFAGDKNKLVQKVLENIAPQTSWHVARSEMKDEDPRARTWEGVSFIVDLMGASAEEEAREVEKTAGASP